MTHNTVSTPNQPINALTIADLEAIIADVVRRVLREELQPAAVWLANRKSVSEAFLATFGSWEDARPAEAIVTEIYESRTITADEESL